MLDFISVDSVPVNVDAKPNTKAVVFAGNESMTFNVKSFSYNPSNESYSLLIDGDYTVFKNGYGFALIVQDNGDKTTITTHRSNIIFITKEN